MRAVVFDAHGGPEMLRLAEMPDPEPGPGEAVVRVGACGVNWLDVILRRGETPGKPALPHVPGSEVAGEVVALGAGVSGVQVGDRVAVAPYLFCGTCEYCLRGQESLCLRGDILGLMSQGGYAEYVRVPARSLVPLPPNLSFEDGAALGLSALTAYHMLITRARLSPGETVLVLAAGSGVGSAAIQIARLAGARVIATAGSPEKLAKARELGAEAVIDHRQQDIAQEVRRLTGKRGVDVVFEHVGQATWDQSVAALARGGRLVTCGSLTGPDGRVNIWTLFAKELSLIGSYGGSRGELRTVLELASRGALRPVIHAVHPLEEAAAAHRTVEAREQFGKLVLRP